MTSPAASGRLGVMIDRSTPPEQLIPLCRALDALGSVDDVWVVEDLSWGGAIAAAATALAVTQRLHVGIGIVPAPLRNPALLAMELATLGGLHPGRVTAGIGHGVQAWMREVGAAVPSPLTLLAETFTVVRGLLAGERVRLAGRSVHIEDLTLVHPPHTPIRLLAGVTGPKSLRLSGEIADGTILAEGTGPTEIAAARTLIDAGRTGLSPGPARGDGDHRIVVLAYVLIDDNPAAAADRTRQARVDVAGPLGVDPDDIFVLQGSVGEVLGGLQALWEAGADTVVVRPIGDAVPQVAALDAALAVTRA
ncbi:MAG: LLM class flavin-dependent oxidoreductase [Nakamurella sp.]